MEIRQGQDYNEVKEALSSGVEFNLNNQDEQYVNILDQ